MIGIRIWFNNLPICRSIPNLVGRDQQLRLHLKCRHRFDHITLDGVAFRRGFGHRAALGVGDCDRKALRECYGRNNNPELRGRARRRT